MTPFTGGTIETHTQDMLYQRLQLAIFCQSIYTYADVPLFYKFQRIGERVTSFRELGNKLLAPRMPAAELAFDTSHTYTTTKLNVSRITRIIMLTKKHILQCL